MESISQLALYVDDVPSYAREPKDLRYGVFLFSRAYTFAIFAIHFYYYTIRYDRVRWYSHIENIRLCQHMTFTLFTAMRFAPIATKTRSPHRTHSGVNFCATQISRQQCHPIILSPP